MTKVLKQFDRKKGLPFWYVDFDSDIYGPFSTREEAHAFLDNDGNEITEEKRLPHPMTNTERENERKAHKVMTLEEYMLSNLNGWHLVNRNYDGFGGVGVCYLSDAASHIQGTGSHAHEPQTHRQNPPRTGGRTDD